VVDASELTRPYALQVGIYAQRQGAQQIVNTLQRRGYQAYVVAVQMEGQGEVYAVRMGGYFTHVAAYNAAQHLTHKERFKVMAVARNNNAERVIL
jgi:cell division septation protein DedD